MPRKKKRADGRYQTIFTYEGKKYTVYARSLKDLDQAKIKKIQQLREQKRNHDNPTLDKYYRTFTDLRRSKVKESTIRTQTIQFQACANVQIDGIRLGDLRIRDITPKDVQQVQKALADSRRSSETVNNYMDHLSHVFADAVRDETIDRNPCMCISHVRRTEPLAEETIHRGLTLEETAAFFEHAQESFYLNHFKMMIQTGLRIGELSALQESDIDTKKNCIHVITTTTRSEVGNYLVGDSAKTFDGKRDIPLNQTILSIVTDQKRMLRQLFGLQFRQYLFPSVEGCLLREYTLNREIARICKRAKIEKFTSHAFRDTFATRFMEQRPQDFKILSKILGHKDTKITLNLYVHVMKESKITAMQAVQFAI